MSEFDESETQEIVDLDRCSKKKSILIGAAITFALGFVSYKQPVLGLPYLLGSLAAAGHFAVSHKISIQKRQGVKLGIMATLLGGVFIYLTCPVVEFTTKSPEQWQREAEAIIQQFYEAGMPSFADAYAEFYNADNVVLFLIASAFAIFFSTVILGFLGGMLGAVFFKKGPPAR